MRGRGASCLGLGLIIALSGGCAGHNMTNPPRSATEQLLLSTAADRAMASVELDMFAGHRVYLDTTYFNSYDSQYAIGEIRDALSRAGALLVSAPSNSDITIEARSGALSIDYSDNLFGIPASPIPIPLTGELSLPEIAIYKSDLQHSYAKIALLAYSTSSRAHIFSSGPLLGMSYDKFHKLLFVSWVTTDIPEKQKKEGTLMKREVWWRQYDPGNMPALARATNGLPTDASSAGSASK